MRRQGSYIASAEDRAWEAIQDQLAMDYATSAQYLLELVQTEPTVVHAIRTLQAEVLHGHLHCRINSHTASMRFLNFINKYYMDFAQEAVKAAVALGFVPWYKRRLADGNLVPSVLPLGSFSWEVKPAAQMKTELLRDADRNKLLVYDISVVGVLQKTVCREDVFIFDYIAPTWMMGQNTLNPSVISPLQNLVSTYRRMITALSNRAHADAWNSHAHIITRQATNNISQEPTASIFEAGQQVDSVYSYEDCRLQLHTRDEDIQEQFTKKVATHVPYVYTLPVNVSLEQAPVLQPCGDAAFLQEKFKRDVALTFGIPLDVVGLNGTIVSERSNLQTQQNDHLFYTRVSQLRRMLQNVMRQAYHEIYVCGRRRGRRKIKDTMAEDVEFTLVPSSGLRLRNVEDVAKLAALDGALSPKMLSNIVGELIYGDALPLHNKTLTSDTPQSMPRPRAEKRSASAANLQSEHRVAPTPRK